MKSINAIDSIVVGAYFLLMLGIGLYFMRVNKGAREYFAGGNLIPWWVSGMTMYMANFSAWTFTGAAGFTYSTGWFAILYFAIWPIAYLTGTYLTAEKWRRTRSISPVEYTQERFNKTTQQLFGWVIALNFMLTAGVQLAAVCKLLAPVLGIDLTILTIATGIAILLYTFLGGVWAVSITDVIQGVILLSVTFFIMPMSLALIGGFDVLIERIPSLSFDHIYNNVQYNEHWLLSIFIIMSIGVAAGQAQRFYSVKDERSAKRVGVFAAILFLTVPLVFGIPPLVARILWPDFTVESFFQPYIGKNPQDLVFIALCLKLLPNGLIGMFIAAMFAATMSTLSSVFNMVSSILAKDVYHGLINPDASDGQILRAGRLASVSMGVVVTTLGVVFIHSQLGIFNIMQIFFTLLNIPIVVPIAAGLLFRSANRWAAIASIAVGLTVGVLTRYVLNWEIGYQVYAQFLSSLGMFILSGPLGRLYRDSRKVVYGIGGFVTLLYASVSYLSEFGSSLDIVIGFSVSVLLGAAVVLFSALFARTNADADERVARFFSRLDLPVDVRAEVIAKGKRERSTMPFVGRVIVGIAVFLSLLIFTRLNDSELMTLLFMVSALLVLGGVLWYAGRRSLSPLGEELNS